MRAGSNNGKYGTNVLLTALSDPASAASFTVEEWDLLLRLARATRLLGRIAVCMEEQGLLAEVPPRVVDHFSAAKVFVNHRQRTARWEINRILAALAGSDMPLVLLQHYHWYSWYLRFVENSFGSSSDFAIEPA